MNCKWCLCLVCPFNVSSSLHPMLFQAIQLLWHYISNSLIHPSHFAQWLGLNSILYFWVSVLLIFILDQHLWTAYCNGGIIDDLCLFPDPCPLHSDLGSTEWLSIIWSAFWKMPESFTSKTRFSQWLHCTHLVRIHKIDSKPGGNQWEFVLGVLEEQ